MKKCVLLVVAMMISIGILFSQGVYEKDYNEFWKIIDRLLTSSKEINLLNQLKDVISLVKAVVEYLFVALVVRAIQVVQVVALMVVLLDAALDVNIKVAQTVVHKDVLV